MLDFKGCENERLEKSLARLMELGPRSDSLAAQRSLYIPKDREALIHAGVHPGIFPHSPITAVPPDHQRVPGGWTSRADITKWGLPKRG